MIELVCTFTIVFLLSWYLYYRYCFNYWQRKDVPTAATYLPVGNLLQPMLGKENIFVSMANYYKEFKSRGCRHAGLYFFNGPVYFPIDPEIIKSILITDSDHFIDRGMFVDEVNYPTSANLFSLRGLKWKNLRHKLSPTFSSGKLKTMYKIFIKMVENFIKTVDQAATKGGEINIKHVSANFAADLTFSTAFGLESNTLDNPDGELSKFALTFFEVPTWHFVKGLITDGFKNPGNVIRAVYNNKSREYLLREILQSTIEYRENNHVGRKDFISLLLEVRDRDGLTFNEILAQCYVFFLAGFETSSQTISYCIHELAHNQEIQEKLRTEIYEILGTDYRKYAYEDVLKKLPYLDNVFNETLRLYPVLGFFNRVCVKAYQVPGTDVVIEEGTPVVISTLGLQRDPEYFPDSLKFDPERFDEDHVRIPCTFLPFGGGPRSCIGARYGKLQTKLAIASLISQFKFFPSLTTPKHIQLDKFSKALVMVPTTGVTVKVEKL